MSKQRDCSMLLEKATLAGGCFWSLQALLADLKGVHAAVCGYATEHLCNNVLEERVSTESVQVSFNPKVLSHEALLQAFLLIHNPTLSKKKTGEKYRSAIFYSEPEQKALAQKVIEEASPLFASEIVTEVLPLLRFEKAPEHQQQYYAGNPSRSYCQNIILPKLVKLHSWASEQTVVVQ